MLALRGESWAGGEAYDGLGWRKPSWNRLQKGQEDLNSTTRSLIKKGEAV